MTRFKPCPQCGETKWQEWGPLRVDSWSGARINPQPHWECETCFRRRGKDRSTSRVYRDYGEIVTDEWTAAHPNELEFDLGGGSEPVGIALLVGIAVTVLYGLVRLILG